MTSTSSLSPIDLEDGDSIGDRLLCSAEPADSLAFDEARQPDGRWRQPWQRFFEKLPRPAAAGGTAAQALDEAAAWLQRQIHADGITHTVYGQQGAAARPWSLELLPALVEPEDWAQIEPGIVQRARLLEATLADVYGPQRSTLEGLLPGTWLHRHPGYLRALKGVRPAGGLHLAIAAFDIARAPDGRWCVLAQRTQGPSGLGYVLHNRMLVSRLFPDAFRELRIQHVTSSCRRLLDTLEALARECAGPHEASPRIVLLTPGPHNETYFEHAYLARHLGMPLAEGADLMVKAGGLYLKTVEGLEPVHGVLRRVDDEYCDPLELKPDSTLGVPGLLQAVRSGRVAMVNALGSGFLESPALQACLPSLCRRLLGEPLALPSLPVAWCGDEAAWSAVRSRPEGWQLRRTFPRRGDELAPSGERSAATWPERVPADPPAWTAQQRIGLSRTPLWHEGRIVGRPSVLRVYAIADADGGWHVMPGGLTRVASGGAHSVSMQRGGSSLDTWVRTEGPLEPAPEPRRLSIDDVLARHRPVSSRTAENLFWLGRYTERTEQCVRLARVTLRLAEPEAEAPAAVKNAVSLLCEEFGLVPPGTPSMAEDARAFGGALLAAMGDAGGACSIGFDLQSLAAAAGSLRDRLSPEHWRLVRSMADEFISPARALAQAPAGAATAEATALLDRLAVQLAAVTGAQSDRMTRDHGWRLMTVGRWIERLIGVAQSLGLLLDSGALATEEGVEVLLELFDSTITFRARYQGHRDPVALADLLVLDPSNPRAWACVLRRLRNELRKLPGPPASHDSLLAALPVEGAGLTMEELRTLDEAGLRQRVSSLAVQWAEAGAALSDGVGRRYFAHAEGGDALKQV